MRWPSSKRCRNTQNTPLVMGDGRGERSAISPSPIVAFVLKILLKIFLCTNNPRCLFFNETETYRLASVTGPFVAKHYRKASHTLSVRLTPSLLECLASRALSDPTSLDWSNKSSNLAIHIIQQPIFENSFSLFGMWPGASGWLVKPNKFICGVCAP